jgi:hypothetical protein
VIKTVEKVRKEPAEGEEAEEEQWEEIETELVEQKWGKTRTFYQNSNFRLFYRFKASTLSSI